MFKYCHFTENLSHEEKRGEISKAMKNPPLLYFFPHSRYTCLFVCFFTFKKLF